jgi:hypothetical protein
MLHPQEQRAARVQVGFRESIPCLGARLSSGERSEVFGFHRNGAENFAGIAVDSVDWR